MCVIFLVSEAKGNGDKKIKFTNVAQNFVLLRNFQLCLNQKSYTLKNGDIQKC